MFKKVFNFLKKPNELFSCFVYIFLIIFAGISIVTSKYTNSTILMSIIYGIFGTIFFYSLYLFIAFDFKNLRNFFKNKISKVTEKNKFVYRLVYDTHFKMMLSLVVSIIFTIFFVAYNTFAGIYYKSIWNGSISVYYLLLLGIRCVILLNEHKISEQNFLHKKAEISRAKIFKSEGLMLLLCDIALVVPVTLLVLFMKDVNMPVWVAIANAAYTFYKVIGCIISFAKSRKNNIVTVRGVKNLNLTDAMVSLLSLENIMIITFSESRENSMFILIAVSAFIIMVLSTAIAIMTYIRGKRMVYKLK